MIRHRSSTDADGKIHMSADDINDIKTVLQQNYSSTLVEAMTDSSKIDELVHLLATSPDFRQFKCYHNKEFSKAIVQEVADLGVIDRLLQENSDITDIGFNGRFLSIETNDKKYTYGNHPGETPITEDYIKQLINRFAIREGSNGVNFSEGAPIFNGFSNNIRISATHKSISPNGTTMSLRISKPKLALTPQNFDAFAPLPIYDFLRKCIKGHTNIIISGETGTGKTELQKLLIGDIPFEDKIIMIEDVAETHLAELYPDKDVYSWITRGTKTTNGSGQGGISISDHVKNALRNNPKWLMISETRGAEAYEMFQAVLSGHNIITTLHAIDNAAVPRRFVGMSSMGQFEIDEELLQEDFLNYMHLGIHIKKKILNGRVFRYLDELSEFVPVDDEHPNGIYTIFKQRVDSDSNRHWTSRDITPKLKSMLLDELDEHISLEVHEEDVVEPIPVHKRSSQPEQQTPKSKLNYRSSNDHSSSRRERSDRDKNHSSHRSTLSHRSIKVERPKRRRAAK